MECRRRALPFDQTTVSHQRMCTAVLTSCARMTQFVRAVVPSTIAISFADDPDSLVRLIERGCDLVLIHLPYPSVGTGVAGYVVRRVPTMQCPTVGLVERTPTPPPPPLFDLMVSTADSWWSTEVRLLIDSPLHGVQRVEVGRLLRAVMPHLDEEYLEPLVRQSPRTLNVKRWSAEAGQDRTTLFRRLDAWQLAPHRAVDVTRAIFLLLQLQRHVCRPEQRRARLRFTRSEHSVLYRTLGSTQEELSAAFSTGSATSMSSAVERLRAYAYSGQHRSHPSDSE